MGRFTAIVVLSVFVVACQSQAPPVASPVPSPSPHAAPTLAILQSGDVPAGLNVCLGSGPIDVHISSLAHADATLAQHEAAQWEQLRGAGATGGAISLFTANAAACNAELGATNNIKSITSVVAIFDDPGQADRAWESGVFGFTPPAVGEILPGMTRGSDTGLGISSWTYSRAPVQVASWHKSLFVALVVAGSLDAATFKAATAAVDARLN
ncbi:MAG: hypothetical protein ABI334_03895 [Candidatus Dormiibacterota bacterium]